MQRRRSIGELIGAFGAFAQAEVVTCLMVLAHLNRDVRERAEARRLVTMEISVRFDRVVTLVSPAYRQILSSDVECRFPGPGEQRSEGGSLVLGRGDLDRAAVGDDNLPRDVEAQPQMRRRRLIRCCRTTGQRIEDRLQLRNRIRDATVADRQRDCVLVTGDADVDRGVLEAVLYGVAEQPNTRYMSLAFQVAGCHIERDRPQRMRDANLVDQLMIKTSFV